MIRQGVRLGMAEQLVANRALIGMRQDQVIDQLGPMAPLDEMALCFSEWHLLYRLDADFSRESGCLVLRFSGDGHVVEAAIR